MKWNLFYPLLIIYFVFLSSCSIEKRHYLAGYHVEYPWKGRIDNMHHELEPFEKCRPYRFLLKDTVKVGKHAFEIDTAQLRISKDAFEIQSSVFRSDECAVTMDTFSENVVLEAAQIGQRIAHRPDPEKKYLEALGFFSFLIAVIGFVTPMGSFFFFVAAIIAGIVSQKKFRKNPGKYIGAGFGILGLILGVLGLITILWILFAAGLFAA